MFAFHENTRRRICRFAFIALCVAPTCATAGWIADHWLPGRERTLALLLSERLDATVELASLASPRPGVLRAEAVRVVDPSTGTLRATLQGLQIQQSGRVQRISVSQSTVDAASLRWFAQQVFCWAEEQPPGTHDVLLQELHITMQGESGSLLPSTSAQAFKLANAHLQVECTTEGDPKLTFSAQAHTDAGTYPLQLTLSPVDPSNGKASTLTLVSRNGWLPTAALESAAPLLAGYGAESHFCGEITWTWTDTTEQGSAHGALDGIDLARLLPSRSIHSLRGRGKLEFSELSWDRRRVTRAAGSLVAQRAEISQTFIAALVSPPFKCSQASDGAPIEGDPSSIALDSLAIRFQLGEEGLTFWGGYPRELAVPEECLAVSGDEPLLLAPPFYNLPLGFLLQTLYGPPTAWVPATQEAVEKAGRLPLPLK